MTRMTRPDCAVMCNLINTHTHTHTHQYEWHRLTRTTKPDCVIMCNLIDTHTHTCRSDPHSLLGLFSVMVRFRTRGEEDLRGNRCFHFVESLRRSRAPLPHADER